MRQKNTRKWQDLSAAIYSAVLTLICCCQVGNNRIIRALQIPPTHRPHYLTCISLILDIISKFYIKADGSLKSPLLYTSNLYFYHCHCGYLTHPFKNIFCCSWLCFQLYWGITSSPTGHLISSRMSSRKTPVYFLSHGGVSI